LTFYWVRSMRSARLLLVDDDADNLEVLAVILSERYRVFNYNCAADALTAVEAVKPDLLVLDIGMRPVDGLECLKTVRAMPGYGSIPAIALTGFARDVERETFLTAGFQAVVTKPILDHTQFLAVITSLVTPVDGIAELRSSNGRSVGVRPARDESPRLDDTYHQRA
jgi:CheY-like chemotaxis protein